MAESKKNYVLDASVILKWFLKDEIDEIKAVSFKERFVQGKIEIIVPSLVYYEVLNIISLKVPKEASKIFSLLQMLKMTEVKLSSDLIRRAIDLVQKTAGIAFYDAVYHALAIETGSVFVTADEKYFKKARKSKYIKFLSEF